RSPFDPINANPSPIFHPHFFPLVFPQPSHHQLPRPTPPSTARLLDTQPPNSDLYPHTALIPVYTQTPTPRFLPTHPHIHHLLPI
ncbi:hypothetical protein Pcinc_015209, partial [Petrolisthes cinctipes]